MRSQSAIVAEQRYLTDARRRQLHREVDEMDATQVATILRTVVSNTATRHRLKLDPPAE